MFKFALFFISCISSALTINAMESGESEHRYLFELYHNIQHSESVSKELHREAYNFVTQNIEQLDNLPQDLFEIYCGLLVELHKCTIADSFEDICHKMASIERENYVKQINFLVDEFPLGKSPKIKLVCCKIAALMFKHGYEPSENLVIYITQEIFTTQDEFYFETLKCFYINLLAKNYIQPQAALNFAESCQEDFKCYFISDIQDSLFAGVKSLRRTSNPAEDNKVKKMKKVELPQEELKKKDNCIIS